MLNKFSVLFGLVWVLTTYPCHAQSKITQAELCAMETDIVNHAIEIVAAGQRETNPIRKDKLTQALQDLPNENLKIRAPHFGITQTNITRQKESDRSPDPSLPTWTGWFVKGEAAFEGFTGKVIEYVANPVTHRFQVRIALECSTIKAPLLIASTVTEDHDIGTVELFILPYPFSDLKSLSSAIENINLEDNVYISGRIQLFRYYIPQDGYHRFLTVGESRLPYGIPPVSPRLEDDSYMRGKGFSKSLVYGSIISAIRKR